MEVTYFKEYSNNLNRDMEYLVYGHAGKICLVFGPQDGHYYDYGNYQMPDQIADYIDAGKIMMVCVDSIDSETWTNVNGDPGQRMWLQELWYRYIMDELVPTLRERYQNHDGLITTGCSMGAMHAANFFFRNPYEIDTLIALSGVYYASYFMKDYMDANTYNNSPNDFIYGLSYDHPLVQQYRKNKIIVCVGQGDWEWDMLPQTRRLQQLLKDKDVHCWIDYWGYDVNHDWPWWRKQLRYFISNLDL